LLFRKRNCEGALASGETKWKSLPILMSRYLGDIIRGGRAPAVGGVEEFESVMLNQRNPYGPGEIDHDEARGGG
jgi:hypothetical protein